MTFVPTINIQDITEHQVHPPQLAPHFNIRRKYPLPSDSYKRKIHFHREEMTERDTKELSFGQLYTMYVPYTPRRNNDFLPIKLQKKENLQNGPPSGVAPDKYDPREIFGTGGPRYSMRPKLNDAWLNVSDSPGPAHYALTELPKSPRYTIGKKFKSDDKHEPGTGTGLPFLGK